MPRYMLVFKILDSVDCGNSPYCVLYLERKFYKGVDSDEREAVLPIAHGSLDVMRRNQNSILKRNLFNGRKRLIPNLPWFHS